MLVTEGRGQAECQSDLTDPDLINSANLKRGDVFYVPAETSLQLSAQSEAICLWIAAVHSQVFADSFKLPVLNGETSKEHVLQQQSGK